MTEEEIVFLEAAKKGDTKTVKELLDKNVDPNVKNSKDADTAALLYAIQNDSLEMAAALLNKKADFNYGSEYETPVGEAAGRNNLAMLELLIGHGANINKRGLHRGTALKNAIINVNIPMVKVLLNHKADYNMESYYDGQPIHTAARVGNWEILQLLREIGADINAQDSTGHTPIYHAAIMDNQDMIKNLVACGGDPNIQCGKDGGALHRAVLNASEKSTKLLLNLGANPNTENGNGQTPAQLAGVQLLNNVLNYAMVRF